MLFQKIKGARPPRLLHNIKTKKDRLKINLKRSFLFIFTVAYLRQFGYSHPLSC